MAQFLEKIKETLQRDAEILRKEFHLFGRHFNLQDDVADGPVSENPEHREKAVNISKLGSRQCDCN